jgi:hypothetical protein
MPQARKYASGAERQAAYRQRQEAARREEREERGLPALPPIATLPGTARWRAALSAARVLVEQVGEEMEAYYQERSEPWQESERGEQFRERLEEVQEALEGLQTLSL